MNPSNLPPFASGPVAATSLFADTFVAPDRFDVHALPLLCAWVEERCCGRRRLAIDASGCEFMDVAVVERINELASRNGCTLTLVRPSMAVSLTLDMLAAGTGLRLVA